MAKNIPKIDTFINTELIHTEMESWAITPPEQQMAIEQYLHPESVAYNIHRYFKITGYLDAQKLENALQQMITKYRNLRSFYTFKDGKFEHFVRPLSFFVGYPILNIGKPSTSPFGLENDPLFRFNLETDNDGKQIFHAQFHHIIMDGVSEPIFYKELWECYDGKESTEHSPDFLDYAAWLNEQEPFTADYFNEMFEDGVPKNNVPAKNDRPEELPFTNCELASRIDSDTLSKLDAVANKLNVSLYTLLISAAGLTTAKFSKSNDIVLGLAMSGRAFPFSKQLIGMFVNLLPIRIKTNPSQNPSQNLEEFIKIVSKTIKDTKANQLYPFEKIVQDLNIKQNSKRSILFDVMCNYLIKLPDFEILGAKVEQILKKGQDLQQDLSLEIIRDNSNPTENELYIELDYSDKVYDKSIVNDFLNDFIKVLEQFTSLSEKGDNLSEYFQSFHPGETQTEIAEQARNDILHVTELEQKLIDIASEITGNSKIGITTELDTVGLHSLTGIQFVVRVKNELGVKLKVTQVLREKTIQKIAALVPVEDVNSHAEIAEQARNDALGDSQPALKEAEGTDTQDDKLNDNALLTQNQLGIYYEWLKAPNSTNYNIPIVFEFSPSIDVNKLATCVKTAIESQPYLFVKLSQHTDEGKGVRIFQTIDEEALANGIDIPIVDTFDENFEQPYNLLGDQLFRAQIVKSEGTNKVILQMSFHHIIFDGGSIYPLLNDIVTLYNGGQIDKKLYTAIDYANEEIKEILSHKKERDEEFFNSLLSKVDSPTVLLNHKNPVNDRGLCDVETETINKEKVEVYCNQAQISYSNFFLGVSSIVVNRFAGGKDVLTSILSNGRDSSDTQNLVGMLVETLPFLTQINNTESIENYLKNIQNEANGVLEHNLYTLAQMVQTFDFIPQINYAYQAGFQQSEFIIEGEPLKEIETSEEYAKFPLDININFAEGQYEICAIYNIDQYDSKTAKSLVQSIVKIANQVIDNSGETRIGQLTTAGSITQEKWLPSDLTAVDMFEMIVKKVPEKTALIATDRAYTYQELNERANIVAHSLIESGVQLEDRIGVMLPRTSNYFVAALGVLKAGAAFIPIDPEYPKERVDIILEDSDSKIIITDNGDQGFSNEISIKSLQTAAIYENPNIEIPIDSLAYLIFTSGSTGRPKGVMVEHKNMVNHLLPLDDNRSLKLTVDENCTVVGITTISFDLAIEEDFGPLLNGLTLVFADEEQCNDPFELVDLYRENSGNIINTTPSRILQYLQLDDFKEVIKNCKIIIIGAEIFPVHLLKQLKEITDAKIINSYGPTEATISTHEKMLVSETGAITIGTPLANVSQYIMDESGNPLPKGIIGELWVGGLCVARGYINRPDLTKEVFVTVNGERLYRTGDLGYITDSDITDSGEVVIVGRNDGQIKLRGLRIELGEVKNAILNLEEVNDAAVFVKKINGQEYLSAYFVAETKLDIDTMKRELSQTLTPYMVPTAYLQLDSIPVNQQGKVDLKKLPEINFENDVDAPPASELEQKILNIVSDITGASNISIITELDAIGLNSISAIEFIIRASKELNIDWTMPEVLRENTVQKLVTLIPPTEDSLPQEEVINETWIPSDLNVVDMFAQAVESNPRKTAVIATDATLTYSELDEKSNIVANYLIEYGVRLEDRIALMLHRTSNFFVAALGVLKAGAAFIPIDPAYPKDRIDIILEDSDSKVIVTDTGDQGFSNEISVNNLLAVEMIGPDRNDTEDKTTFSSLRGTAAAIYENPNVSIPINSLAYLIFTSGSTGRPKGVQIEHQNLVNQLLPLKDNIFQQLIVKEDYLSVGIAPISFDVSIKENFGALLNGLTVVFANELQTKDPFELVKLYEKYSNYIISATPSRMLQFLQIDGFKEVIAKAKVLYIAAEIFSKQLLNNLRSLTDAIIINGYGPTETTIVTHEKILQGSEEVITIGKPLANTVQYIMDEAGNPLPKGATGELWLGGLCVSRGYINRDDLTRTVFVEKNGVRLYRSGDLAYITDDNEVVIVGRNDDQIKLRGQRVELGEIKSAILGVDNIINAAVLVKKINGQESLCAYFIAKTKIDIDSIRSELRKTLTSYMIPSAYLQMDEFPLTPSGKTDSKRLPDIIVRSDKPDQEVTDLEQKLLNIVSRITGVSEISVIDELDSIGLNSISVIDFIVQASNELNVEFTIAEVGRENTIQKLVALLGTDASETQTEIAEQARNDKGRAQDDTTNVSSNDAFKWSHSDWKRKAPLTQNQLGIYYEWARAQDSTSYNIPLVYELSPTVDIIKLAASLKASIESQPYFFVKLSEESDEQGGRRVVQAIDEEALANGIDIPIVDTFDENFEQPYNLLGDQLFRAQIVKSKGTDKVILQMSFHHIIFDGGSIFPLIDDVINVYNGNTVTTKSYTAINYALDEEKAISEGKKSRDKTFYESLLSSLDSPTVLLNHKDTVNDRGLAAFETELIDKDLVEEYCKKTKISYSNFFLAVSSIVINRFSGGKEVLLSLISNGRDSAKTAYLIGMLVETLPYLTKLDSSQSIVEYLKTVQQESSEIVDHKLYSLSEMNQSFHFIPQINFAYQAGFQDSEFIIEGEPFIEDEDKEEYAKFPLDININFVDGQYEICATYNIDQYSSQTIKSFVQSIAKVINQVINAPLESVVGDLSTGGEVTPSNFEYNDLTVVDMFENAVKKTPDKTALVATDRAYTYQELNEKANIAANYLIQNGINIGDCIGVMLSRTSNFFVAVLGILKAGAAYIPIDPEYPNERISIIIEDSQSKYIVTDNGQRGLNGEITVTNLLQSNNQNADSKNPSLKIPINSLAYLIFTSGSTGRPKGVMVEHRNIVNQLSPYTQNLSQYNTVSQDCIQVGTATVSFDLSIKENFGALLNGVTLVFADEVQAKDPFELVKLYKKYSGDVISATPSRMLQYLALDDFKEVISKSKVIFIGAEMFPKHLLEQLRKMSDAMIVNAYGPTEAAIATHEKSLIGDEEIITIGSPLANVSQYIMDETGNPLPNGIIGELWVGGLGISRGYIGREDLTKEVFVTVNGERLYKTGDLGYITENGEVVIIGRNDGQIKLRGLRIELDEIKNAILAISGINDVAVLVRKINGTEHLSAYYIADTKLGPENLRNALSQSLTPYMVPTAYLQIDKFPVSPSGKTDFKALPDAELLKTSEYAAPQNDGEKLYCGLFASILHLETSSIGVNDSFFDLGGTSLSVSPLIIGAQKSKAKITYADVFKLKTPRELASYSFPHSTTTSTPASITTSTVGSASGKKNNNHSKQISSNEAGSESIPNVDKKGNDYTKINQLLKLNTIESFTNGELLQFENIALTGATGFLGIHILYDFIKNYKGKVCCMVRGGKSSAKERLKSMLFFYFEETIDELFGTRIFIVEGDVTDKQAFRKLDDFNIDAIFNCAAVVKHFSAGTEIEDVNIGGVINGLEYVKDSNIQFIHISTESVSGCSQNGYPDPFEELTEQKLYFGQLIDNQYVESKFEAERLCLEAATKGAKVKIMRVGNLMARNRDGEFQINFSTNNFINNLKAFKIIGKAPYSVFSETTDISPIDSTAKAILKLATSPKECLIFHPSNFHYIHLGDIFETMNEMGLQIEGAERGEFSKAFDEAVARGNQESLLPLIAYEGEAEVALNVNSKYSEQVLLRLGFWWPIIDKDYTKNMLDFLVGLGFFDE
jgi:amino acid adenylation domain-containing protein